MPVILITAVIFGGVNWIIPSIIIAAVVFGGIDLIKKREMKYNKLIAIVAVALVGGWFLFGSSPIHEGAIMGNIETVKQAIAAGADVNEKDDFGFTPLHWATTTEIAGMLISKGADVNAKTDKGTTPLDRAILGENKETADFLRKHGGKTSKELKAEVISK